MDDEQSRSNDENLDSSEDQSDVVEDPPDSTEDQTDSVEGKMDSAEGESDESDDESDSTEDREDSSEEETDSSEDSSDLYGEQSETEEEQPDSTDDEADSSEEEADSAEDESDESDDESDSSEIDINRSDAARRKTRNLKEAEGNGVSLQGIITFFSVGSVVLLLIILGFLVFGNLDILSLIGSSSNGTRNADSGRGSVELTLNEKIQISDEEDSPLDSAEERKAMKAKLKRLVREIRAIDSFQERDKERINKLRDHLLTILDFVASVREKESQEVLKQKKKQALKAEEKVIQLRDHFLETYSSDQQPDLRKKLDSINLDIIWSVRDELDSILNRNQ